MNKNKVLYVFLFDAMLVGLYFFHFLSLSVYVHPSAARFPPQFLKGVREGSEGRE